LVSLSTDTNGEDTAMKRAYVRVELGLLLRLLDKADSDGVRLVISPAPVFRTPPSLIPLSLGMSFTSGASPLISHLER
jgi:hypothetical protein